ncbi:hypothetical protein SD51_12195 [Alicyclobacillus tengchongensis]|nr:hypothetical protein SD51_12195 [Alicyclobacillus tengchongensis]
MPTIKAIDLYEGSPTLDFSQLKADGIEIVIAKAIEGATYHDSKFREHYAAAKAHDLYRGAYGFARPGTSAAADEAKALVEVVMAQGGFDLPPILDWEDNGGLDNASLRSWGETWVQTIENEVKRKPIIYGSSSFFREHELTSFDACPLWIADYGVAQPDTVYWSRWTLWQYTDQESVQGHPCDMSWFNGDIEQLRALCNLPTEPSVMPAAAARADAVDYTAREGDTLSTICLRYHVPLMVCARYNLIKDPNVITVGQRLRIPMPFVVRAGDTLSAICDAHKESVSFVAYVNGIENPNCISVGQVVYL